MEKSLMVDRIRSTAELFSDLADEAQQVGDEAAVDTYAQWEKGRSVAYALAAEAIRQLAKDFEL